MTVPNIAPNKFTSTLFSCVYEGGQLSHSVNVASVAITVISPSDPYEAVATITLTQPVPRSRVAPSLTVNVYGVIAGNAILHTDADDNVTSVDLPLGDGFGGNVYASAIDTGW
jgi:hypothetical protein